MAWEFDDEIGYGKPPRYTRFRKGQSGNPKGRPKKGAKDKEPIPEIGQSEFDDALRELFNRKVAITIGGEQKRVSVYEAVALKQQADALGGSVTAQRDVLRSKEQLDARDAVRRQKAEEQAREDALAKEEQREREYKYLVKLHAERKKAFEEAEVNDQDPEPYYPHPEDFRFDHAARKASLVGPFCEKDEVHFKRMVFERDYYILSYVIQSRQRPKASAVHIAISEILFILWDVMLPRREQLVADELDGVFLLLFSKPMTKLRQQRDDVNAWLNAHPLPEPGKQQKRETYNEVNAMMMPLVKKLGFRSLAQLERHCEDEEKSGEAVLLSI